MEKNLVERHQKLLHPPDHFLSYEMPGREPNPEDEQAQLIVKLGPPKSSAYEMRVDNDDIRVSKP